MAIVTLLIGAVTPLIKTLKSQYIRSQLAQSKQLLTNGGEAECLPLPATNWLAQRVDLWQWQTPAI